MNQTEDLLKRVERLNRIGVALSGQGDYHQLLELILTGAREMTGADAGTLYTLKDRRLHFEIMQTASLGLAQRGGREPIPLYDENGDANNLIVVRTALSGELICLDDAYHAVDYDFSGTLKFDEQFGYRSTSFLSVPLKNHQQDVIGVLQLINALDSETGQVRGFSEQDRLFAASLASQAAVTLTKNQLIDEQQRLFEALIRMIAAAIDEKSPYTGDHCRRVPVLTMLLARAVNASRHPPFADLQFTDAELYELEVAAWLHDCGKLITPVYVVDKGTKLETIHDRMELVRARFEIIRRDLAIARLLAGEPGPEVQLCPGGFGRDHLQDDLRFLAACNQGDEALTPAARERVAAIAADYCWIDGQGERRSVLSADECMNLQIPHGTLNDRERGLINQHIQSTINMLSLLPFPKHLARVPEIAGAHHERIDGRGYPAGLSGEQLPLQGRILAIADVFEALTARDRPYKKGKSLSTALRIMQQMAAEGHLDRELFALFVAEELYQSYAEEYLSPEQRDRVDPRELL